jgi:hypothetical protein
MPRETVPIEQINALIQAEMQKSTECAGVQAYSAYWHEPDADGCNWDINTRQGDSKDVDSCRDSIQESVRALRAQYNIPEPTQAPPEFG